MEKKRRSIKEEEREEGNSRKIKKIEENTDNNEIDCFRTREYEKIGNHGIGKMIQI